MQFLMSVIKFVKEDEELKEGGYSFNKVWPFIAIELLQGGQEYAFKTFCHDVFVTSFLSLHYHINDKIIQHQLTNQVSSMTHDPLDFL